MELNPTEILIVAQIMEIETNAEGCSISNEIFAENFGVSITTINRCLKELEAKGLITRDTKNTQKGKVRYIKTTLPNYNAARGNTTLPDINKK